MGAKCTAQNSRPKAERANVLPVNDAAGSVWKPSVDRRQSFSKEDHKRAMQMTTIDAVKTGPGFTEHK